MYAVSKNGLNCCIFKINGATAKIFSTKKLWFPTNKYKYRYYDKCKVQTLRTSLFVTIATNTLEKFK